MALVQFGWWTLECDYSRKSLIRTHWDHQITEMFRWVKRSIWVYTKQNTFHLMHSKISMNIIILGVRISDLYCMTYVRSQFEVCLHSRHRGHSTGYIPTHWPHPPYLHTMVLDTRPKLAMTVIINQPSTLVLLSLSLSSSPPRFQVGLISTATM